jgi:hypothetical protein
MPVENAEYQRLSEAKALEVLKPKNKVLYRPNLEQTGPNVREVAAGKIGGFVVCDPLHWERIITSTNFQYSNRSNQLNSGPRRTRLPGENETSFLIKFLACSANILIGNLPISRQG